MTYLAELENEIDGVVEIHESDLASTEGGGSREIPEGVALAVVTGYVETGKHANKNGKVAPKGFIEFMLFDIEGEDPKYNRTYKDDNDKEILTGTLITHRFANISRNDKAHFRKDVDAMFKAAGIVDQSSPVKLFTKTIMVEVVHNKSEDGKKTYTNLNLETCKPAFDCDRTGKPVMTKPLTPPVPVTELPLKLFIWAAPSLTQWATIEIEGTYTTKDEKGVEVEKSKNWIQELVQSADNFGNSPAESMLLEAGNSGTPLPKATKAKAAKKAKDAPEATESSSEPVSEAPETPSTTEVAETSPEAAEAVSKGTPLTEVEEAQLVQYDSMIDMCESTKTDASQFVTLRDALIAKRDGV